jgi:3,4-dihydroxy 2-butanone 4-phosphate synthase/GTP cyclohydrolase II
VLSNRVERKAEANIPTTFGQLKVIGYQDNEMVTDHIALIKEEDFSDKAVPVRIHSECLTGEAFGSKKCDCGSQLDYALDYISNHGEGGVVIYLRGQEGRGIGLINKLRAYNLQEQGFDTIDANLELGLPSEAREYGAAVSILEDLGIKKVKLLSNNPAKAHFLLGAGIEISEYLPVQVGFLEENKEYMETKRDRMGHSLPNNL